MTLVATVRPDGPAYPVYVVEALAGAAAHVARICGPGPATVLTDSNVGPLYLATFEAALRSDGLEVRSLTVAAGEASKSWAVAGEVVGGLVQGRTDRGRPVIALGGGVVGDLAGFAASVYRRGVPVVHLPTSLLAQVDSAIGGKTGVDVRGEKNSAGTFHQPLAVVAPVDVLATLPPRERRCGLAEAIKTALVGDPPLLDFMEREAQPLAAGDPAATLEVVRRCAVVKAAVVSEDPREERGRRLVLNLGHTLGHALESAVGLGALLHGEAVALGLIAALRLSVRVAGLAPAVPGRVEALLRACGLETDLAALRGCGWERHLGGDKKVVGSDLQLVALKRVGAPVVCRIPTDEAVKWIDQSMSG